MIYYVKWHIKEAQYQVTVGGWPAAVLVFERLDGDGRTTVRSSTKGRDGWEAGKPTVFSTKRLSKHGRKQQTIYTDVMNMVIF